MGPLMKGKSLGYHIKTLTRVTCQLRKENGRMLKERKQAEQQRATYEGQEPGVEEDVGHVNVHGIDEMHQVTAIICRDL